MAAVAGERIVGAVRTRQFPDTLQINRLTVAPDVQGQGIGTTLLVAAERAATSAQSSLFTGPRSEGNLRLYRGFGYVEQARRHPADLVHLVKDLTATGAQGDGVNR